MLFKMRFAGGRHTYVGEESDEKGQMFGNSEGASTLGIFHFKGYSNSGDFGPFWCCFGPFWSLRGYLNGPGWANMTFNHVLYPQELF